MIAKHLLMLCVTCCLWMIGYTQVTDTSFLAKDTLRTDSTGFGLIHIQDIRITGKQMSSLSGSLHKLTQDQISEQKGNLLAESLSQIAGLSTIGTGNSIIKPVINGLHSNRILLLNQGVRQEAQQWGVEHAPEIDPFVADRLEVIKGAQGVRYGSDALGGVILITADDIDSSRVLSGELNAIGHSNGRGVIVNGKLSGGIPAIPGLGWRIQASGKQTGNYQSADYYLGNTGSRERNFSGTLQYLQGTNKLEAYYSRFSTELGVFRGAHIATAEDIEARIAYGRPYENYTFSYAIEAPRQTVAHDLAKLQWRKNLSNEHSLDVLYAFQRNHRKEFDLRRVATDDTPMADMVLTTQNLDVVYRAKELSVGGQASVQVNNNTPGTGTTPIIPNFDSYTLSAFTIQKLHFAKFHAEAGLRYDYKYLDMAGYRYDYNNPNSDGGLEQYLMTDNRQFHNLSGTAGILYHILPYFNWKSNIGLAWRAPSANELYSDGVHHGSGSYEVGDKNLLSEKGLKWVNSLIFNTEKWQATADIYAQMIYDYIYAQPSPDSVRQTIRGTFPLFAYKQHNAFFYGADLSLTYSLNKQFGYHLNASLVRAQNTSLHSNLPYIPADRFSHALQWTPVYAPLKDAYIKLAHRFVDRQTHYDEGTDYAAPPAAYHLFDLVLSKRFALAENSNMRVLLSANNLFNTAYKDYMDRFRYFAHQMGRNIQLKLSYQF